MEVLCHAPIPGQKTFKLCFQTHLARVVRLKHYKYLLRFMWHGLER